MSSRLFLVVCEDCPPYDPISVMDKSTFATQATNRRGKAVVHAINPVTDFTDNMWCRRGETIVPGEVSVKGFRNGS